MTACEFVVLVCDGERTLIICLAALTTAGCEKKPKKTASPFRVWSKILYRLKHQSIKLNQSETI